MKQQRCRNQGPSRCISVLIDKRIGEPLPARPGFDGHRVAERVRAVDLRDGDCGEFLRRRHVHWHLR